MTLHAEARTTLAGWSAPDRDQAHLRDRYVAHLDRRSDGCWRACLPEHLTASLLVLDRSLTRTLLTLHAKSGRWFQFGGHLEPGDATLAAGALREGVEESGLDREQIDIDDRPLLLDAHTVPFCGPDGAVHLDVMFAAVTGDAEDAAPTVSPESLDVRWWRVDQLPDPELEPFVIRALERLGGHPRDQSTSSAS